MSATGERPFPADRGATLLEMLVVVALLAMSTAIAFPLAAGCYERLAAQVARSAVAADLRSVRSLAARTDAPVSLQVFDDGRRYRAGDRDVLLPASIRLSAQPARITFFPTGVAEGAELRLAPAHGTALTLVVDAGAALSATAHDAARTAVTFGGPRPLADHGSVLVDALVALGVLSITLTLASQAVQAGLQRSRRQEEVRMAQLIARSRLAEVGADIPLAAGRSSGQDGPLAWTVTIAPDGAALWAASVEVTSPDGSRLAQVQTLRPAAP